MIGAGAIVAFIRQSTCKKQVGRFVLQDENFLSRAMNITIHLRGIKIVRILICICSNWNFN